MKILNIIIDNLLIVVQVIVFVLFCSEGGSLKDLIISKLILMFIFLINFIILERREYK